MAITVKPVAQVVDKWKTRAAQSANFYAAGTVGKGAAWQQGAQAAAGAWAQGVQNAVAANAFASGVSGASPASYDNGVKNKGVARWGPGVAASVDKYQNKMTSVLNAISGVTLPPRGPRGDAGNYGRVQAIGTVLHDLRRTGQI